MIVEICEHIRAGAEESPDSAGCKLLATLTGDSSLLEVLCDRLEAA